MALGNTFGATTFCSFGAYWITFATLSEIDITNPAAEAMAGTCQAEILMGIFMMVRRQSLVLSSIIADSYANSANRHGSSSQPSCCYAPSSPALPCF